MGNSFSRRIAFWCVAAVCSQFVSLGFSQSKVWVSYEDELLPVVAMQGATPVVSVNGEWVPVVEARVRVESADRFTDGAVEVVEHNALMGQDLGSPVGGFFFRFSATVRAERDFEDCFVLFVISSEKGNETYVIREIPDINMKGIDRISVTLPINSGFGGRSFEYRFFTRGEEIRCYEPDYPLLVEDIGDLPSSSESRVRGESKNSGVVEPAKVLKARLLDFPENLVGKLSGGYATALYLIDEEGNATELLHLAADHADFLPEVWKTVAETHYQPGTFNGKKMVTTVKQNFFFNEFASFSEALEMLPYPNLEDRNASVIYAPMPDVVVSEPITVMIEFLVDPLGRVRNSRVVEGAGSDLANLSRNAVEKWIFLPAIVNGYPTEQAVKIPLVFSIKE